VTATAEDPTAQPGEAVEREEALARLGTAFKGAMGAIRRLRGRDTHRPGELSFAQYHLLFGLAGQSELSSGELAQAADLAPATVTQMLDSLAAMGLVERTRSERDRRIVTCALTPRGRELVADRRQQFELRWTAALAGFDAAALATAATVLDHLRAMYDGFADNPVPPPATPLEAPAELS
jgi:DNA-binding MarR family transcriptional regulator